MVQVRPARARPLDDAAIEGSSQSRNFYGVGIRAVIVLALTIAGVVVFTRVGDRQAVLAVARPVPAGQVIDDTDIRDVRLSTDPGVRTVVASDRDRVVGMVAKVTLVPGTTLAWDSLSPQSAALASNEAVVGISLKPGTFPKELRAGDRVQVVQGATVTGSRDEQATTLVPDARVRSVAKADRGSEGSVLVSLVVPASTSAAVAAGAAAGRIALAVVGSV